jgi:hypothetical protein
LIAGPLAADWQERLVGKRQGRARDNFAQASDTGKFFV